ncbi:MAG: hypothetical protein R3A51_14890 [Nannocystaceae bacterium]|nr:hypothetical protein [Myxococcales bacterium]
MNDRRRTLIAWLAALALACGGDDGGTEASTVDASTATDTESSSDGSESESETDTDTGATTEPGKTDSVDILFVVDNSETMGPAQGRLGFSAGVFIEALLAAGLDLRVGVTTTDMGNPRCMGVNPPPQLGRLEPSSCVQRIDEFTLDDIADSNVGCLDICQHNSYSLLPTAIDDAPGLTQRSWLESIDGVSNVDVPLSEAVACMLPQGITGCGFESPLEAMHAALTRGDTPGDPNEGFVRDDADLLVIFFSDELDCSFDQSAAEVFIANQTFWAPGSTQATSAVCWNAGVTCDGAAPGPYSSCHAENKDVSGASGVPDPAAVLRPMSRYRALLDAIADEKAALGHAVRVAGIVGVPPGYPGAAIGYQDSTLPEDQVSYGIGWGCVDAGVSGLPPVRVRELQEDVGGPGLYSICAVNYIDAMDQIASTLIE